MRVRVQILFESPGGDQLASMGSLAQNLTNDPVSVRVSPDEPPGWLVAEFTMPTESQYVAVPKIDRAIRFWANDRLDSIIRFPKSEAERTHGRHKAEQGRSRRRRAT